LFRRPEPKMRLEDLTIDYVDGDFVVRE